MRFVLLFISNWQTVNGSM